MVIKYTFNQMFPDVIFNLEQISTHHTKDMVIKDFLPNFKFHLEIFSTHWTKDLIIKEILSLAPTL